MQQSFWESFLKSVEHLRVSNQIYHSVLSNAKLALLEENSITLICDSTGSYTYLQKKRQDIEEKLTAHTGRDVVVEILLKTAVQKTEDVGPLLEFKPSIEDLLRQAGINPGCSFDNFAVSTSNQVAFAASQAVAKNLGSSYNPLFLYGGVGVGKSHIAQAVARHILNTNRNARVLFCSGEKFMNDLIEAIRGKKTPAFRNKYRSLGLIILDDIQFIAGKQTVQEEFFHTFNSVVSAGGQVILTSDKPPHEIRNLEDRLRSRFSGGLLVDIQSPGFELRAAILLIKAKEKNIEIDMSAAKAIADIITDTRGLEGTLLSLYARSLHEKDQKITLDTVEAFFQKSAGVRKVAKASPQEVMRAVCAYYNVKQAQLRGSSRKREVALTRQIVMYLLRTELEISLADVAFLVKRQDHTTVMHAVNKIQGLCMKDVEFKKEIDVIRQSLYTST
ncbi:MAG: chromosomal replication initiator protein DnaA [bacterium]|nr:chromosomal replication initiator protein DnaA [bacterium]